MQENTLISNLLSERSNFILIGLTGRTGSGCSTAANLLTDEKLEYPQESQVNYEKKSYFSGLDKKRYDLVRNYATTNHSSFSLIKISDLITSQLFNLESPKFIELLKSIVENHYLDKIEESEIENKFNEILENISQTFPETQKFLCTHEENNPDMAHEEDIHAWKEAISAATIELKNILKNKLGNCYVKLYQHIGDSIRHTTQIHKNYREQAFNANGLHIIPQMCNKLIKIYRKKIMVQKLILL